MRLMASMIGSLAGNVMDGLRKVSPKDSSECHRTSGGSVVSIGKSVFCDGQMPSNLLYLGLIQKLYPNARIIHSKRNMLDTCVSCFRQNFNASYSCTTSRVRRMMARKSV